MRLLNLPKNIALNEVYACGMQVPQCPFWNKIVARLSKDLAVDIQQNPYSLDLGYLNARSVVDKRHQTFFYNIKREFHLGIRYAQLRYGLHFLSFLTRSIVQSYANNFRLYDHAIEISGADLIVDSSKTYLKAVGLYKLDPKKVRIIQLVRDGRGVFYSGLKRGCSRSESLNAWEKHYSRALPIFRKHINPVHILRVKYEDLAQDTRAYSYADLRICRR